MGKQTLKRIATLAVIAVIAAVGMWALVRALASPDILWTVVRSCVEERKLGHVFPVQCVSVDRKRKLVILRSVVSRWDFLAVPTIQVTGIEDPRVRNPEFPNYWALAWSAAIRYLPKNVTKNRADIGLAVNSVPGRSQNQLHIHISCVEPDVVRLLDADQREIGATWSRPLLEWGSQRYRVMRVESPTLDRVNPFLLLLKLPGAAANMGLHTLVVTGARWEGGKRVGFYLLDDYAHRTDDGSDHGHGEDLLDENCRGLTFQSGLSTIV